jgi:hypothetical protein
MNGLITEGIPLGQKVQILTSGLGSGLPPPVPPPTDSVVTPGFDLDKPTTIVDNEDGPFESEVFAIPSQGTRITWQVIGTTPTVDLEASLDGENFAVLDSLAAAGVETIQAGPTFLRANVSAGTDVTVIVTIKREKK